MTYYHGYWQVLVEIALNHLEKLRHFQQYKIISKASLLSSKRKSVFTHLLLFLSEFLRSEVSYCTITKPFPIFWPLTKFALQYLLQGGLGGSAQENQGM